MDTYSYKQEVMEILNGEMSMDDKLELLSELMLMIRDNGYYEGFYDGKENYEEGCNSAYDSGYELGYKEGRSENLLTVENLI
jgi:hypothetical protein